jgi:indolepyruvate ferredoxin oxidoreductase beta subunit
MPLPFRTRILVAALGGQGGGVLTDWIVGAARAEGYVAQATSTPGVSQRTGATTYYVEIAAQPVNGEVQVLGLSPVAGRVDVLVCAELLEAARVLERGFCTPLRTTVVASTHRVYTTREKMSAGDDRYDSERIVRALRELSSRAVLFDMEALRKRHDTAISAALFGALAGSGALPVSRQACEQAIGAAGKGVSASVRAFADAYEQARRSADRPPPSPQAPANHATGREGDVAVELRMPADLASRVARWPARVGELAQLGVAELCEYQDGDYAATYVNRVERILAADAAPHDVTRDVARFLALWMRYDDLIRVASLKSRRTRFATIRSEAAARDGDVVRVYDFFKPGAIEVAAILPSAIGGWLEARALSKRRKPQRRSQKRGGITLQASSITGAIALRSLAALRPLRPHSLRFAREQQAMVAWLDTVLTALQAGAHDAARDLARLPRLIRGYGDTHASGRASFERILAVWREGARRDAPAAAVALRAAADAAFNGTGCASSPSAPAARSVAPSSPA